MKPPHLTSSRTQSGFPPEGSIRALQLILIAGAILATGLLVGPAASAQARRIELNDYAKIFIAEHGSWNRTRPIGDRVTLVQLQGNRAVKYEVFAEGWLEGERPWGRPVDVQVMPDGALLVSDDFAGAIYRIAYRK